MRLPQPHSPSPSCPRQALSGRCLLVAGATGFLGKVWLAQLLHHVPEARVIVLARGRGEQGARERVAELLTHSPAFRALREALGPDFRASMRARVRVLEADIREPISLPASVREEIDLCVNLAGTIDFVADPREALAVNVEGALNMASLAEATHGRRLIHVSTCYVSGPGSGARAEQPQLQTPHGLELDAKAELDHLRELAARIGDPKRRSALARARAQQLGWPNVYTLSKVLAEAALLERANAGLRLSLVRPSIVENAVDYPFAGWNEGLKTTAPMTYLMNAGLVRVPGAHGHKLDIIPVDDVGRGLLFACAEPAQPEPLIWQLGSSATNPLLNERFTELTTLGALRHGAPGGRDRLLRLIQPRVLGASDRSWRAPKRLHGLLASTRRALGHEGLARTLAPLERGLGRAAKVAELLEPFILDHDYAYAMDRALERSAALPEASREAFALRIPKLDWRDYIVDVLYPGQQRWCFPLIEGKTPAPEPRPATDALALELPSATCLRLSEAS